MIRLLQLIIFAVIVAAIFAWYLAQVMPEWYENESSPQQQAVQQLTKQIESEGVDQYLGAKFNQGLDGELTLSEAEFNALFQASLQSSRDGRRLLRISDAINTEISEDGIELGVVLNLRKISKLDARAKAKVEKVFSTLPLLEKSRVFLTVKGMPIVRDGELAVSDDFTVTIGNLPISNKLLEEFGMPANRITAKSWPISLMSVESISTGDGEISIGVLPRL